MATVFRKLYQCAITPLSESSFGAPAVYGESSKGMSRLQWHKYDSQLRGPQLVKNQCVFILICFMGKVVATTARCELRLSAYHLTGECPSTLDNLDSVGNMRLVRSVIAALDNSKPQPDMAQKGERNLSLI